MTLTVKYLKHLQLEGKAENTIDTYKYHLIEFLVWISEQNVTIFDVKRAHLPDFKNFLSCTEYNALLFIQQLFY